MAEATEFEPTGTQQQADAHEREPIEATESEPTVEGRRYPLKQRKASSWYPANQYVLQNDEGEPEGYEETMEDVHKEK